jgi:hypothetical protein
VRENATSGSSQPTVKITFATHRRHWLVKTCGSTELGRELFGCAESSADRTRALLRRLEKRRFHLGEQIVPLGAW